MKITDYIKSSLKIKSSPERMGQELSIADDSFKNVVLDLSQKLKKQNDFSIDNQEASEINDILVKNLGYKKGSVAPLEMYSEIRQISKICSELIKYLHVKKEKRPDGLMGYLYSPQGAFIDRASKHLSFIAEYYVDVTRFIIAKEIYVESLSDAPAMKGALRQRIISFCEIFKFYAGVRKIEDLVHNIPDITIPTDEDIRTASAVYKPGILDPMIASIGSMVFTPVRVGMSIKANYDTKKYILLREKVSSLEKMLLQLGSEERLPSVIREIESSERRIKEGHIQLKEMEDSVESF